MSEEDPRFPDVGWSQGDDPWIVPSWLEPAKDVPAERPAPPPPAGVGSDARVPDDGPTTHFFFDDTALDPVPVSSPYVGGAPAGGALADGAPTPAARPGRPGPTVHPGSRPRLDDSAERRRLAVVAVGAFVAVALLAVLLRVVSGSDEKGPVAAHGPTVSTTPGGNLTATPPTGDGADAPPDATGAAFVDSGAADPAGLVASGGDTPQAGTAGTAGAAGPGPAGRSASGSPTAGAPVGGGPALAPTPSGSPASNNPGESRSSTQVRTDGGPASARVSASGRSTQPSSGPTGGGGSAPTGPTGGGGGGGGGAPAPAPSGAKNSSSTGASSSNTSSSPGTPSG